MGKVTKTEIFLLGLTALFLAFSLLLFFTGERSSGSGYSVSTDRGQQTQQEPQPIGPLNINRATAEQLQSLDGIGPVLAQRIVEDRALNGPFSDPEELLRVDGIGPGILNGIRDSITTQEEP